MPNQKATPTHRHRHTRTKRDMSTTKTWIPQLFPAMRVNKRMYLWWSLCTSGGVYVPLVEFMYLVFTRMPGESYLRRLRSLLLYLCYVFRALINSLVCWFSLTHSLTHTDTRRQTHVMQSHLRQVTDMDTYLNEPETVDVGVVAITKPGTLNRTGRSTEDAATLCSHTNTAVRRILHEWWKRKRLESESV